MTVIATDIQAHVAELCDSAFGAFCGDMSSMFGIDVSCNRQQVQTGPAKDLWKQPKKLGVNHQIQATGAINGTFHLCFDQAGLFVLSGVIVMLPEARIVQQIKSGSTEDAQNLQDAARELGNLLVGSWDRIFRENCSGHGHFAKKSTFLGKPWEDPGEAALSADEEVLLALYEMTVEPYPSFRCAAIFPKAMSDGFGEGSDDTAEEKAATNQPADAQAQAAQPTQKTPSASKLDTPVKPTSPSQVKAEPPLPSGRQKTATQDKTPAEDEAKMKAPPEKTMEAPPAPQIVEPATEATADADEARWQTVVQESLSGLEPPQTDQMSIDPGGTRNGPTALDLLRLSAEEIMTQDVLWADPDDTVQQCIAKMQQQDCRYVLVGRNGVLEGIVSNSGIQAALSPYLRPMFAKWRRPEDDATLSIKIKWIMSRPVRTATPQTTMGALIESMFHHGGRCLPVVNDEGVVQGIVTVFDILARILEADGTSSWKGKPRQSPPLLL